jgi:streptogramin lyase
MRASLYSRSAVVRAFTTATRNASANGDTVNLNNSPAGAYQSALFVIQTNTITDGTHVFSVEESDNGSAWTTAPASSVHGTNPSVGAANDDTVFDLGYVGLKQFCRLVVTVTPGATGGNYGAICVKFGAGTSR